MKYLNVEAIKSLDHKQFASAKPFPWANPQGLLTETGFENLRMNLPEISIFEIDPGYNKDKRSKNRWELNYDTNVPVPSPWVEFIKELKGVEYRNFLQRMLGIEKFNLRFQWHFCADGFSIVPHVDSVKKLATHIFYLNTERDWDEKWGGQTVILDNHTYSRHDARQMSDFTQPIYSKMLNNRSLLWKNTDDSWHAASDVHCPKNALRLLFTVIIEQELSLRQKITRMVRDTVRKPEIAANSMQPVVAFDKDKRVH